MRSFSTPRARFYYSVQIVVSNRSKTVLDWMRDSWGGWVVPVSNRAGLAQPTWNWRCPTGQSAVPFLTGIRFWLRIKGPQCDNALAMIALLRRSRRTLGRRPIPAEWLIEQEHLYWIQRELNHRGVAEFEAKAMHSPRKIHRARMQAASSSWDMGG